MNIHPVNERTDALIAVLTDVWESSVRATHTFLTEVDIAALRQYVPDALRAVEHLTVLLDDNGQPAGFCRRQRRSSPNGGSLPSRCPRRKVNHLQTERYRSGRNELDSKSSCP